MEVCFLRCKLALGTLDPQDSGMEHHGTTETRMACLHLGDSAARILHLEREWVRSKQGFVFFTLYTS